MKVYLSSEKPKTTVIEHNYKGVKNFLEFSNNTLAKTAFVMAVNDENPIFSHLNRYLEKVPSDRQDEIFEIISEIQTKIENSDSLEVANDNLKRLFVHLFSRIRYQEILNLVLNDREFARDITLPSPEFIKMRYESVSDNYTKEKTYIYSEYQELIALIIQMRLLFPLMAHYIEIFSPNLGTDYKEFEAMKVLQESDLFKNPAMLKLIRYVHANTPDEGSKAAIINFISSEDYPMYNLAMVLIRKICTMDIRNPGERQPVLIMHISTHVREKISNNDKKAGSIIADKIGQDTKQNSEERQISMMERFKIRDKLSVEQKVFITESVSDPVKLGLLIKPDIDLNLLHSILAETVRMNNVPVENVQKILLRLVISQVVSRKVVDLINRPTLVNCLAVAATILIQDGFPGIAQFCTATVVPSDGNKTIATDQHQNKVTAELRSQLNDLMPFQRAGRSKTAMSDISNNVDIIFKDLTSKVWHSNLPDNIISREGPVIRRIKIPGNLRIMLTELAIYLAKRSSPIKDVESKLDRLANF